MKIGEVLEPISLEALLDEAIAAVNTGESPVLQEPERGAAPDSLAEAALGLLRASPETALGLRWDDALRRVNRPEHLRAALEASDMRDALARYLAALRPNHDAVQTAETQHLSGFVAISTTPEVLTVLASNIPAVIAGLYGTAGFAPGLASTADQQLALRSEIAVATEFAEHASNPDTHVLPAAIRAALDAAIPAVVAAAYDEFTHHPPHIERTVRSANDSITAAVERDDSATTVSEQFASGLIAKQRRFRSLASEMAHRVVSRGARPDLAQALASGKLDQFRRSMPLRAANGYILRHVARILAESPGSDHSYESYLAEHTLGIPRELNLASHVSVGDYFEAFPEITDATSMDRGLALPHKVTLRPSDRLFHPYLIFHKGFSVPLPEEPKAGQSQQAIRKASLLELVYGLTPDSMRILQQIVLGEAAVVGLTPEKSRDFFNFVATSLREGEPLDGRPDSVFQIFLDTHVQRPVAGGQRRGADLLRDLQEKHLEKGGNADSWLTGPRALTAVLTALGADRVDLAQRLVQHSREMETRLASKGIVPRARSASAQISVAPVRREVVSGVLAGRTLLDAIQMRHVPVLRTPGLAPGETLERDADATFRLHREIVERALLLSKDPTKLEQTERNAPDDMLAEVQTLLGYMVLGKEAYSTARLPHARSVAAPERLGPGIAEALSGKEGLIRSVFFGTRFDNSARLKLLPNWRQTVDQVTAPPYTVAVVRGDYLRTLLADPHELLNTPAGPDLQRRIFLGKIAGIFARQTKSSDFAADISKWAKGFLASIERDGGTPAALEMRAIMEEFCGSIPQPNRSEALRLFFGQVTESGALAARRIEQHIANAFLTQPLVAPLLDEVNRYYPVMISRYPVIHHHSYAALHLRVGDPESNAFAVHPIVAVGLGGDFDGDAVDMLAPLPYSRSPDQASLWREMMLTHSPSYAMLNSASGTDLVYRFALNASEGMVKANLCYVPAEGLSPDQAQIESGVAESTLQAVIPPRDTLLHRMRTEPELLLNLQGQWIAELRQALGQQAIPVSGFVAKADGSATTLARLFLHEVVATIAGVPDQALGPRYLAPGEFAVTSGKKLEELLQKSCVPTDKSLHAANPGEHLAAVYGAFYGYFSAEATTATQSAKGNGLNTPAMFEQIGQDPLVARIRDLFAHRLVAVEQAFARGVLTMEQAKTMLLRLEAGERNVEEKDEDPQRPGLSRLLGEFRSARSDAEVGAAEQRLVEFIDSRAQDPRYGLKPLAKACVRIACERFARRNGHPHLLVEQVLTDKVKASDEVLFRFFIGTANVIDGESVPTTYGGLVGSPTVERLMKSGAPALDKAIKSKMAVPATGTAFKEYELELASAMVTSVGRRAHPDIEQDWQVSALSYRIADYTESEAAINYLAHQLTLRTLRVKPSSALSTETRTRLDQELRDAVEVVPFDRGALIGVLKRLAKADPAAEIQARSVLLEQQQGKNVSAEAAGYITTGGPGALVIDDQNRIRRVPLAETRCLGYPIGAILSGALGEMATQAALRTRHITGSGIEEYLHRGDWHKLVHGPFPQRSPFYRRGGDRVRSTNPLAHAGMEACAVAFTAKVPNASDQRLTLARTRQEIGGVEVFPGEKYSVASGQLVVGTDRPKVWALPIDPSIKWTTNEGRVAHPSELPPHVADKVEAVAPTAVHLQLSPDEAARCGLSFADCVADYRVAPQFAPGALALRAAQSVIVHVPAQSLDRAVASLEKALPELAGGIAARAKIPASAAYNPVAAAPGDPGWRSLSALNLIRYRVAAAEPVPLGDRCPLHPGMVIDPVAGLATTSAEYEINRGLSGFDAYLGFLSGKPLDTQAPLSLESGSVVSIRHLARRGETSDYEVTVAQDQGGAPKAQIFRLPKDDLPAVVPGQRIECGRPLSFGAVELAERCRLRHDVAKEELAEYLMASSYGAGKRSPAPVVTELLTKTLFANGTFTPIRQIGDEKENRMAENPWQLAGRSGRVDALLGAAASPLLTAGFGRVHAFPDLARPPREQMHPAHLFPSLHPMEMPHASALAERLAAIGIGTKLLQPLVAGVEKAARRASKDTGPKRASGFGVERSSRENETPLLDR